MSPKWSPAEMCTSLFNINNKLYCGAENSGACGQTWIFQDCVLTCLYMCVCSLCAEVGHVLVEVRQKSPIKLA